MNKYNNSKIYAIRSPNTDKIYIGATTRQLHERFLEHKSDSISSKDMFNYGNCYIELIEIFSCKSFEELSKREGELIRQNRDKCVNLVIAGRTDEEWFEDNKEYRKEYKKMLYEDKIDYYKERYKNTWGVKIKCQYCDKEMTKLSLKRHIKTIHENMV